MIDGILHISVVRWSFCGSGVYGISEKDSEDASYIYVFLEDFGALQVVISAERMTLSRDRSKQ
jgi:hypothetical protein